MVHLSSLIRLKVVRIGHDLCQAISQRRFCLKASDNVQVRCSVSNCVQRQFELESLHKVSLTVPVAALLRHFYIPVISILTFSTKHMLCRSQLPRGLRHKLPSPGGMLCSFVRISLEAWMSCAFIVFVLSCFWQKRRDGLMPRTRRPTGCM